MQETELIDIYVNGERQQAPHGESIAELLERLGIASERVAVELDRNVLRKRDWPTTIVREGSQIEIVEFVGGG
jgi:thiamine biosynthesis protein ThiS